MSKQPESILAIDPSINNVGWAIFKNGDYDCSGIIKTKGNTDVEKLESFWIKINDELDLFDLIEDAILIIEIPDGWTRNGANVKSLMKLCKAVGFIEGLLNALNKIEVPVSEWKGRGKKAQSSQEIEVAAYALTRKKCGEHEAHAVMLGWWASQQDTIKGGK